MNLEFFIARLAANAEAIERWLKDVEEVHGRWKPAPEKWSILEVVCHLCDEERLDFRTRLDMTLNSPGKKWPPIDPIAWVTEHQYTGKNLREQSLLFYAERQRSIGWLRGLESPDWSASYQHPKLGEITAGSLLGSWLAHDYLHLRQLASLHYLHVAQEVAPHSLDYAGPWNPNG